MTQTRNVGSAASSSVLRGVMLHGHPHVLARPDRFHADSTARLQLADLPRLAPERAAGADTESAFAAGLAEGLKRAREEAAMQAALEAQARETMLVELRERSAAEGRLQGMAQGREQAFLAAEEAQAQASERFDRAAAERLDRLDQMLDSLSAERVRMLAEAEDDLVCLSHEIVCRILGEQAARAETLRSMVPHLLARHGQQAQFDAHVHPDDLAALEKDRGELPSMSWKWVADTSVQLGGVVLHSPGGSLDARLETQLAALRATLLESRRDRKGTNLPQSSHSGLPGGAT